MKKEDMIAWQQWDVSLGGLRVINSRLTDAHQLKKFIFSQEAIFWKTLKQTFEQTILG